MTRNMRAIRSVFLATAVLTLAACGGGGSGGSSGGGNVIIPPSANAGADQSVTERAAVQVGASGGGSDTPLTFAWTQVSGTTVTLNNANTASANFTAPDVAAGPDVLTLRVTVTDSSGRTASDDLVVTVNDIPPSANAGVDQAAFETTTAQLAGSGSGSDAPVTFSWTQVSGPAVTIVNANTAAASFTAPNAAAGAPEVVTLRLTVTDATGRTAVDDIDITVSDLPASVTLSGKLEFEFPPPNNASCNGLNFNAAVLKPMRGVTVQLIDTVSGGVLQTTQSDTNGDYSFVIDPLVSVFLRVRAELKQSGAGIPDWDVEVRDNTNGGTIPAPQIPLGQRPLYVLDGPRRSPNAVNDVRDMLATDGWDDGTSSFIAADRTAAPFAILDTIYSAMQLIVSGDPLVTFAPLDAFWSVNNRSTPGDIDIGELGSSFYRGDIDSLFLLGSEGDDIEEFDDHVIAHEWGHYFEDNFSRSDSIGGSHGLNDRLDPRVAFGEGFATALSGMALNNPVYCDVFWSGGTLRGFDIPIETEVTGLAAGWYNESSVMKILYDLWDIDVDGADTSSIGFAPIYDVFTGPQSTTSAFTSIFSFIEALKLAGTGENPFIDGLLAGESIDAAGIDRWGSTETNDAGVADSLPVYTTIVPDGTVLNICSNSSFDSIGPNATGNKLNEHRFLRMNITLQQRYTFDIQADAATIASLPVDDPADAVDQSDPDMLYFLNGQIQNLQGATGPEGLSGVANVENFTSQNLLPAGEYVIDFNDFRYEDTDTDAETAIDADVYPPRTCFDFSVTPAP